MTPIPLVDYPLPVEITNQTSSLLQWMPFYGSVLLFAASMITVWLTNRAANRRHREQVSTTHAEGRAERAARRNDRFREEVANLLGERWQTENVAYELADAIGEYQRDRDNPEVSPNERFWKARGVRDEHTPQLNKVEHLAIRASLLTNDAEISAVLDEIRTIAQLWKDLVDNDPYEKFIEIRDRVRAAFTQLEILTRRLVTSDGAVMAN